MNSPTKQWTSFCVAVEGAFIATLVLTCCVGSAQAAPRWTVLPGVYEKDERFPRLLAAAERARKDAARAFAERFNLRFGSHRIDWAFETSAAGAAPRATVPTVPHGYFELGRILFDGESIRVELPARKFLADPAAVKSVIFHETAHAVLASHRGELSRYTSVPWWFREGLSQLFAGEGAARLRERIGFTVFRGQQPTAFLHGVRPTATSARADSTLDEAPVITYAEAFLAVDWLSERLGDDGMSRLLRRVCSGRPFHMELASALGTDVAGFSRRVNAASRERVERAMPAERARVFQSLLADLRRGKPRVVPKLEVFLGEDRRGPLGSTLHYLLAKEALRGDGDGFSDRATAVRFARAHVEALLEMGETAWRAEALVMRGECQAHSRRPKEAQRTWRLVKEVFGEDLPVAERADRLLRSSNDGVQ